MFVCLFVLFICFVFVIFNIFFKFVSGPQWKSLELPVIVLSNKVLIIIIIIFIIIITILLKWYNLVFFTNERIYIEIDLLYLD